jgi:hypothetical protein
MITGVSLRLLYLIFVRVLALVLLMGRTASALVVVTSDNDDQIKGDIWRELIALDATFGLPGKLTLDGKWHAGPSNEHLVAFGRKPSDRNPTGLQGFHARHLLVTIDECCGLPKELWDGADSLASNEGNDPRLWEPNGPDGVHGRGVQAGIGLGGPADPVDRHPGVHRRAGAGRAARCPGVPRVGRPKRRMWGATSPAYVPRIIGEFPDISNDTLIMPRRIEAAQARTLERTRWPKLGADIARYGGDKTTIYRREGRLGLQVPHRLLRRGGTTGGRPHARDGGSVRQRGRSTRARITDLAVPWGIRLRHRDRCSVAVGTCSAQHTLWHDRRRRGSA